jgi:signal transduction histidine kinase
VSRGRTPIDALYLYSLVPVAAVSLLLGFTVALHGGGRGLVIFCLSLAFWAGTMLFGAVPQTAEVARRLATCGGFVLVGFLHAAWALTDQKNYVLVWLGYAVAGGITLLNAIWPGMLYDPVHLQRGPFFWHGMAATAGTIGLGVIQLWRAGGRLRKRLALVGIINCIGAWSNATLLAHGYLSPWGLYLILVSLVMLAGVITQQQDPTTRRLQERSFLYISLTAMLTGGCLFSVMQLLRFDAPQSASLGVGALFVLVMAALAVEPLRAAIQRWLMHRLAPDRTAAPALAEALTEAEARADHAERLAELGTLASAVAHEVRNPLGVLKANLRFVERDLHDAETLTEMRAQIERAERFVEDLLAYGRPRPLELRQVELRPLIDLAWSTARQGLGDEAPPLTLANQVPESAVVEVDQAQLAQVLVILFENAHWALAETTDPQVKCALETDRAGACLHIHDNGPGVPEALKDTVFDAFVSGRKREGRRAGTGLGLPIARRILTRHGGTLDLEPTEIGACFTLRLPRHQPVLGALAPASEEPS